MIVYYTGTGNSRFAAEAVQRVLNDECVNAFDYIKNRKKAVLLPKSRMFLCALHIRGAYREFLKDLSEKAVFQVQRKLIL